MQRVFLLFGLSGIGVLAQADIPPFRFPEATKTVIAEQSIEIMGALMQMKMLEIPMALELAWSEINWEMIPHVYVQEVPMGFLFSGVYQGKGWVIQMHATSPHTTQVIVSSVQGQVSAGWKAPPWLPAQAQLLHQSRVEERQQQQHFWMVSIPASKKYLTVVRQQLERWQWKLVSSAVYSSWVKETAQLSMHIDTDSSRAHTYIFIVCKEPLRVRICLDSKGNS